MLGRLEMGIEECIDAYLFLSNDILHKKRHRVTINENIQGRINSEDFERAVKQILKQQGMEEDVLLKDNPDEACKFIICTTSKKPNEVVFLTSYRSLRSNSDLLNNVKIWEACRATSAAFPFFDPIAVGRYKEEVVDSAIGANNSVMELWIEDQAVYGPDPLDGKVQCLVSIGTGIPSLRPFPDDILHIGKALLVIATETEQTAERLRRDKTQLDNPHRYFRIIVTCGLGDIGLSISTKAKEIAAATRRYISSQGIFKQIQTCETPSAHSSKKGPSTHLSIPWQLFPAQATRPSGKNSSTPPKTVTQRLTTNSSKRYRP